MNVGDKVRKPIEYGMSGGTLLGPVPGTVVYVHPSGRWYTAEFKLDGGTVRESFLTMQLTDTAPGATYEPLYAQVVRQEPRRKYVESSGLSPAYLK